MDPYLFKKGMFNDIVAISILNIVKLLSALWFEVGIGNHMLMFCSV